jgi:saccharopine dehydrogenase (NAD+, L-lysine-forming)
MNKIAVFGATGQAGRLICQQLNKEQNYEIIACARTLEKLEKLKAYLDESGERIRIQAIDLHRSEDLDKIVEEADLIIGATSQWQDALILATKAAQASTHYCGTYLSNAEKWNALRKLDSTCLKHGTMIVDDCGTHPGLPAAMIRRAMLRTPLKAAWVGGKFDLEWDRLDLSIETATDFMAEIESTDPSIYLEGEWKRGYSHSRPFKFLGAQKPSNCIPMLMEEIRELAQSGVLPSTGFFIAGFSSFFDYVIIPVSMLLTKINRTASGKLLIWGLQRFASRPRYAELQLETEVEDSGKPVRMVVSHDDPYFITAVPVVETIRQMLNSPKPGVWTQGMFVEPEAFFDNLQQAGIGVDIQV